MTTNKKQWRVALLGAFLFFCTLAVAHAADQIPEGTFEGVFPPTGWLVRNQSTTIGSNTNCWNLFTGAAPWVAHAGVNHTGANFNCTTGTNTISGWLLSKHLAALQNGNVLTFWTRKASPDTFPDRLQVRLCVEPSPGDTCGAAGSTGATSTDVGIFTTLLLDINPTLITGVYPTAYTLESVTLSGLPAGLQEGRIAFRYFVTSGGPSGANSDLISIDDASLTDTAPVELMSFEVE